VRAVADAGPLIRFSWIDRLDLLGELFDEVLIPVGVWREVVPPGATFPGVEAIVAARARGWFRVRAARDRQQVRALSATL
jgi:predicted nucleic acid-binding protein